MRYGNMLKSNWPDPALYLFHNNLSGRPQQLRRGQHPLGVLATRPAPAHRAHHTDGLS
jgi:hypothetical protein